MIVSNHGMVFPIIFQLYVVCDYWAFDSSVLNVALCRYHPVLSQDRVLSRNDLVGTSNLFAFVFIDKHQRRYI